MTATILPFPGPFGAALSGIPDDELVCTISRTEDIDPALFVAALVVWVGWLSDPLGPAVRRRRDLAAAVTAYLVAGARRHGEPCDPVETADTAAWLIEKALVAPGTPLRRLA